jgi:hypothetical protein
MSVSLLILIVAAVSSANDCYRKHLVRRPRRTNVKSTKKMALAVIAGLSVSGSCLAGLQHLTLLNHMHQLEPSECFLRGMEILKTQRSPK